MSGPRFLVLGAGPAGLWAALELARRGFQVEVLERGAAVGGNAGSFTVAGQRVDYGSHRLHSATDPAILARLAELLGDDLLDRPRHGRIRLGRRWLRFPLRPLDLLFRVPPSFAVGIGRDLLTGLLPASPRVGEESFATVLERGLGRTICREFYFPYARKIWGLEPEEIDAEQARRRVSSGSIGSILRRMSPWADAARRKRRFFYPRLGFGQICEAIAAAAEKAGARLRLRTTVERVRRRDGGFEVLASTGQGPLTLPADRVWSTIPARHLVGMIEPQPPAAVREAAARLTSRAMVLVYLVVETDRLTPFDAHYFPADEIPFTRISEPKVYADRRTPAGRTVLCAEIPCGTEDEVWQLEPSALGRRVTRGLETAGIPLTAPLLGTEVRRLGAAYPVYARGFASHLGTVDGWLGEESGILSFGRQGLFVHDNTHHAMFMAQAAVDSLDRDGRMRPEKWADSRRIFATHVVED